MNLHTTILLAVLLTGMSCREKRLPYNDNYTAIAGFEHCQSWGSYNVLSPDVVNSDGTYYMVSEDYCAGDSYDRMIKNENQYGYLQLRSSTDLISWQFCGFILKHLPKEALAFIRSLPSNEYPRKIPHLIKYKDKFRLYLSIQSENPKKSWMGLLESSCIKGPWTYLSELKLGSDQCSNPSLVEDAATKEQWMYYTVKNQGVYCTKINPVTGVKFRSNDKDLLICRAITGSKTPDNPFIFYNSNTKYYYLLLSFEPEPTTYNVRVGRSRKPNGPFVDLYGNHLSDSAEIFPILIHPYHFQNHPGWAGTGHLSVINFNNRYFAIHQARLSPDNILTHVHIRELFWQDSGWPVLSPERFAAIDPGLFNKDDISGKWEIMIIKPSFFKRSIENGQILEGENRLAEEEFCLSSLYDFKTDGTIVNSANGLWKMKNDKILELQIGSFNAKGLILHRGFDWENSRETILFSGMDENGYSIWGKKRNPQNN